MANASADSGRVLIVGDDPVVRRALEHQLAGVFSVSSCARAGARQVLDALEIDVVVLDGDMPDRAAWSFLQSLAAAFPCTLAVVLTDRPAETFPVTTESERALAQVLSRPCTAQRLCRWVHSAVGLARISRATRKLMQHTEALKQRGDGAPARGAPSGG